MSTIPVRRTAVATAIALAFVAASSVAGAEEKRQPAQDKSVKQGPAGAPKARDGKGRTETVDKDETISIHRKK
jgi:hypothetical protein